jgi:hypothetical protein
VSFGVSGVGVEVALAFVLACDAVVCGVAAEVEAVVRF